MTPRGGLEGPAAYLLVLFAAAIVVAMFVVGP